MAKTHFTAKKTILTVIILAVITVVLGVIIMILSNPERVVTHKIESIANDYYENYFYPNVIADNSKSPSEIFSKYSDTGFTRITFRQLLLFDNERHAKATNTIATYCDLNKSFIQIFPESPFGKTNYHIDYHYSCNF